MTVTYKIIENWDPKDLTAAVNAHLKAGWELQGGCSISVQENSNRYYVQAVVKTDLLAKAEVL